MKRIALKPVSIALCAALLIGSSAGITALAVKSSDSEAKTTAVDTDTKAADTEKEEEKKIEKDETVYVIAGADGSVQKIIVSDWLKNAISAAQITDSSELENIETVGGDQSYTMSSDGSRVWDAAGNDIYYRGDIKKELPVDLRLTYMLDGKIVSADEIAGKSGHVTIRFDYKNNQYSNVTIGGKEEKIYVPFAMLTGLILDGDNFSNVEINAGKVISDGSRYIAVGLAFPGLSDDLEIDSDDVDIPDYVEISADTESFSMSNTVTVATNSVFSSVDPDALDDLDKLTDAADQLDDGMKQLIDGSAALYEGVGTLLDRSGDLIAGVDKLVDGADRLRSGSDTLASGASALASGAKQLAGGLAELDANSAALRGGAEQVFSALLSTADKQLAAAGLTLPALTADNYDKVLSGAIASLDETKVYELAAATAREKVTAAVEAQRGTIEAAVTEAVRTQVEAAVTSEVRSGVLAKVLATQNMTVEQYKSAVEAGAITAEQQAAIKGAVDAQMASDAVKALIAQNTDAQMSSDGIKQTISTKTDEQAALLIEQNMNSAEVQEQITAALEQAKSGAADISALKGQLDSYSTFYSGLCTYTYGVSSAKDGADSLASGSATLSAGADTLRDGLTTLYDGILSLRDGVPALRNGVSQLRDGAKQLDEGLGTFNTDGISKLTKILRDDIGSASERLKAIINVSRDYNSFSGITDETDGNVKFIYRTDSIGD